MTIFELLFGFQGRINRAQWWLGQLTALGLAAIFFTIWSGWIARYGLTSDLIHNSDPSSQIKFLSSMLIVGMAISSTIVWVLFSLAIKRAHDRDQPGWRALAYGIPFLFAILMPNLATKIFAGLTLAWYFLELGLMQGSRYHNAYGPPPAWNEEEEYDADPLDTAISENIERYLAEAKKKRQDADAGSAPAAAASEPAAPRQASFGRRVSV